MSKRKHSIPWLTPLGSSPAVSPKAHVGCAKSFVDNFTTLAQNPQTKGPKTKQNKNRLPLTGHPSQLNASKLADLHSPKNVPPSSLYVPSDSICYEMENTCSGSSLNARHDQTGCRCLVDYGNEQSQHPSAGGKVSHFYE